MRSHRLSSRSIVLGLMMLGTSCGDFETKAASPEDAFDAGDDAATSDARAAVVGGESGLGGATGDGADGGEGGATGSGGRDDPDGGAADSSGASGAAGSAGHGGSPPTGEANCDDDKSPLEDPCVLEDAVFVAWGPPGTGTRESPAGTISEGLEIAAKQHRSIVVVCNATYEEKVALRTHHTGVRVYGGFGCPGDASPWGVDVGERPWVKSLDGLALDVVGVSHVHLEQLGFESPAGAVSGASSIAARVLDAEDISLTRVTLVAGEGRDGDDGSSQPSHVLTAAEQRGNDAEAGQGGAMKMCICGLVGPTIGGQGGSAAGPVNGGGGAIEWVDGVDNGGTRDDCLASGTGGNSGQRPPAVEDGIGAPALGEMSTGMWVPAPGIDGSTGLPGQGGGGGGAAANSTSGGGGGGCGGCGGGAGRGGQGGGGSIALLSLYADVELVDSTLVVAHAGHAGAGGRGLPGQPGALGGSGFSGGCPGGKGGDGSDGGDGGGGAGGVSAGVLFVGAAPPMTDCTVSLGYAGEGGVGGVPGTNDGIDGVSAEVLEAP